MKKLYMIIATTLIGGSLFAGGIVTNTNQSAQFVRMLSRNASYQIDAVYFNPAGVTRLSDGFHLSFNNQSIFQTKTITSTFPSLNNEEYIGDVAAPLFPSFFAVYKKDKISVSFGFGPNGGGGSAEFKTGLPSFEIPISTIPGLLNPTLGTTQYAADIYFNGSSIYWGSQLNFSYEINEKFSAAAGVRMINAKNTYQGHINDIQTDIGGGPMQNLYQFLLTVGSPMAPMFADIEVDATQTGMAFTPILSVMYSPNDKLDIAVKYELNTALTLTNDTKVDGSGMFVHDSSFRADIPAFLSVGIGYKFSDKFRTQLSFDSFFDKQADWGGKEDSVENNMWSLAVGLEYDITEKLTGSLGYMRGQTGVGDGYQTDISYSNSSNTIGLGVKFMAMENLAIDLGAMMVFYDDSTVDYPIGATSPVYSNTYAKSLMNFAVGVSYNF